MNYSIYAESTPNPEVMKFVSNRVIADKSLEILNQDESKNIPLANELFKLPFVRSVFLSSNFVSITKDAKIEWETIARQLRIYISDYLNSIEITNHTKNILPIHSEKTDEIKTEKKEFTETEKEIADILDQYILPAVESDGGSITLHSYKNGIVFVTLRGACSGCPSSTITLKQGIESLLKEKLGDKIKEVISNDS
ncbi:MAG TPA: NifU family protein [Flavobacteriales bacterium]|nr:NifU family protein [Flavobacteriales bacterium]